MKYLIREYQDMTNSEDPGTREEGERKCEELMKEYWEAMRKARETLPKKFLAVYDRVNFHDFEIVDIHVHNGINRNPLSNYNRKMSVTLTLYDYYKDYGKDVYYELTYKGIKSFNINVPRAKNDIGWGDYEFDLDPEGFLVHRIGCHDYTKLETVFKYVSLKKVKKEANPAK